MKHFFSINDIDHLPTAIREALVLKNNPYKYQDLGKNKTLGMLFFNPSLRTRLSTQKAAIHLGMNVIVMNFDKEGWSLEYQDGTIMDQGKSEHIKEAAQVVSQYCDIIAVRAFAHLSNREEDDQEIVLNNFMKYASVPVLNMESATRHPLQALTDAITIDSYKTMAKPKVVLSWAPHPKALPQAVANSFVSVMKRCEVDLTITHPEGFELASQFVKDVPVMRDQEKALENADFVYVKNWSSYKDYGKSSSDLSWMLNEQKMKLTNNAKFMHCLPIRRNVVATDAVLDSQNSIVIEQANHRTYAAQYVLKELLTK